MYDYQLVTTTIVNRSLSLHETAHMHTATVFTMGCKRNAHLT